MNMLGISWIMSFKLSLSKVILRSPWKISFCMSWIYQFLCPVIYILTHTFRSLFFICVHVYSNVIHILLQSSPKNPYFAAIMTHVLITDITWNTWLPCSCDFTIFKRHIWFGKLFILTYLQTAQKTLTILDISVLEWWEKFGLPHFYKCFFYVFAKFLDQPGGGQRLQGVQLFEPLFFQIR
jgi:hypothetical protein